MKRNERHQSAMKPRTFVLNEFQLAQIKAAAVKEATRKAFILFMSIPVVVLHDKFGFGNIRLDRFMRYALYWYESVQDEETTLMEMLKIAENECGFSIREWEDNYNDSITRGSNQGAGK